jgi:hypothetical protein
LKERVLLLAHAHVPLVVFHGATVTVVQGYHGAATDCAPKRSQVLFVLTYTH